MQSFHVLPRVAVPVRWLGHCIQLHVDRHEQRVRWVFCSLFRGARANFCYWPAVPDSIERRLIYQFNPIDRLKLKILNSEIICVILSFRASTTISKKTEADMNRVDLLMLFFPTKECENRFSIQLKSFSVLSSVQWSFCFGKYSFVVAVEGSGHFSLENIPLN